MTSRRRFEMVSPINYYEGELKVEELLKNSEFTISDEAINVCDLECVVRKFQKWQKLLPRIKPFYAVKCNDDAMIMKTLADLGTSFDCASKNEIKQVLGMGVTPDRIIFANPCKPLSHIKFAEQHEVKTSTVDTEFEIFKLYKHYPDSNLVLRIRSEAKAAQCPLGDKFGCNLETEAAALLLVAKGLGMNVTGVSFHVGSGCDDLPAYATAIKSAKNVFNFAAFLGYDMKILDIGGGFPGSDDMKFEKIASIVNNAIDQHFPIESGVEIIAEPGRYFVAAAYTLICKIHAKREVRSESGKLDTIMYYINDGVYGSFNSMIYDHFMPVPVHYKDNDMQLPKFKSLIWGPTCDAFDKILENVYLPQLCTGDLIGFPNMGAYTLPVASPFNGFEVPKTIYFKKITNKEII